MLSEHGETNVTENSSKNDPYGFKQSLAKI